MKKFSFLFAAVFLHVYAFCQFSIGGKVIDENNQPLSLANVVLENTFNGTYTDAEGNFVLKNLKKGTYKLKVSFIGYETNNQTIEVNTDILNLSIMLKKADYIADEITVQATRSDKTMSGSQTSINKETIRQNNTIKDIPFLLSMTPSVVTTSDAGMGIGYTGISVRGSDVRRINVTINDIPLNDAESHGVWWVDLPDIVASTDNIQIQRGVGSSTNGAGAFGATINMQTLTLNKDPFAELNTSYGSYNTSRIMLNTSTGLINNHFNVDLRLSKIYSDGYIDRASSNLKSYYLSAGYYTQSTMIKFINFSGYEKTYQSWNGNYKARFENDYAGMDTLYSHGIISTSEYNTMIQSNSNTCNIYSYDNQTDNYWQHHYQLHITHEFSDKWNNHTALHYTKGKGYYESFRENKKFSKFGLKPIIIGSDTIKKTDFIDQKWLDNDFYGIVTSFNYHQKSLLATIGLGANRYEGKHFGDLIWAKIAPDTMVNNNSKKYRWYNGTGDKKDANIYTKINYHLLTNLSVYGDIQVRSIDYTIGGIDDDLRNIAQSKKYLFFNPKCGMNYDLTNNQSIYASFAVAHREPDRSNFTDADSGKVPKPEQLLDYELAYQLKNDRIFFGINFYYMNYRDQLVMTGAINNVGTPIMTNVANSYRRGIELEFGMKVFEKILWNFNLTASQNKIKEFVAYIDDWDTWSQKDTILKNTDISYSPSTIIGSNLSYEPIKNLKFTLQTKYVGSQYLDNTQNNETKIDAYLLNNLIVQYTLKPKWIKEFNFQLALNNLSNKVYVSNGWAYTYNFYAKKQYAIAYYPQAPFHFSLSLSLKF